jgi:hypothetical protein
MGRMLRQKRALETVRVGRLIQLPIGDGALCLFRGRAGVYAALP